MDVVPSGRVDVDADINALTATMASFGQKPAVREYDDSGVRVTPPAEKSNAQRTMAMTTRTSPSRREILHPDRMKTRRRPGRRPAA